MLRLIRLYLHLKHVSKYIDYFVVSTEACDVHWSDFFTVQNLFCPFPH